MLTKWNEDVPIYKQLETQIVSWILNGTYSEGESLPSVRKLSIEMQINHLTVAKSFQALVDLNIIEKKRGLGMFVKEGALNRLIDIEKAKFFDTELPNLVARMEELNINIEDVLRSLNTKENNNA